MKGSMSIFDRIKASKTAKTATLWEQYVAMVSKADEADSEALLVLIDTLGISVEQARKDSETLTEAKTLQPLIDDYSPRSKKALEARHKANAYGEETQQIMETRSLEYGRLTLEQAKADSKVSQTVGAVGWDNVRASQMSDTLASPLDSRTMIARRVESASILSFCDNSRSCWGDWKEGTSRVIIQNLQNSKHVILHYM